MEGLWSSLKTLSRRQKLVVIAMIIVILLTWLAVCLVLVLPAG